MFKKKTPETIELDLKYTGNTDEDDQRGNFKEFVNISKWVFKTVFTLDPINSILLTVFDSLDYLRPYIYSYLTAYTIDFIINQSKTGNYNIQSIYPLITLLGIIHITLLVFITLRRIFIRKFDVITDKQLYIQIYRKISKLDVQTLEDPKVNNKISRATQYYNSVMSQFRSFVQIFGLFISLITSFSLLAVNFPILVPIAVIGSVPIIIIDGHYRKKFWHFRFTQTENMRRTGSAAADITAPNTFPEIKINNSANFLDKIYEQYNMWFSYKHLGIINKWGIVGRIVGLTNFSVYILGLVMVFKRFIEGAISVGMISFHLGNIDRFQNAVDSIINYANESMDYTVRVRQVYSLYQLEHNFTDGTVEFPVLDKGPEIEVKDLNFKYPNTEKYVLHNINMTVKPGEKVAIVGQNGAGKTTLIKLIAGLYKTPAGSIKVNGYDLDTLSIQSYHNNIGVLFQEFNTHGHLTVKENIFIGRPDKPLDEAKIIEATKNSDAYDFIQDYPNKFDQVLSERFKGGVRPSWGQWQKIAIARFFYRDAPLVIFDEPTAAIDAKSEYTIFNKIYSFFKDKTVLIISHRFSTVRNADRIIVIQKGSIIEQGSHEELMRLNGEYATAFRLQAEGYAVSSIT